MNIFFHELKAYRKSTIVWSISLVLVVALLMSLFPAFTKDVTEFKKLLEGYPEPVRKALGMDLNTLFSILGFYCYSLTFITLCGAIQAMNIGTSIVSKEVREKTADFLLTKPVTRKQILTAKLLAAVVSLIITNIIYFAVASFMAFQVKTDDLSFKTFVLLSLTIFFVQLMFLSLGIIFSVALRKIKSVLSISLTTVFAFEFITMLITTADEKANRYFSPLSYFDTAYIMEKSKYEVSFLLVGAAIILVAVAVSYFIYSKKDIHAV
jgi:ABC-2 type transport system permease protein